MKSKFALALAICLVLALAACAPSAPATQPDAPETPEAPEAAPGIYTPGTYEATAQGFGGEVKVSITVDDTSITGCVITGDDETAGIGSNAVEQLPERIIAANSAEVDAVTGASISSQAILDAAAKAIDEAKR